MILFALWRFVIPEEYLYDDVTRNPCFIRFSSLDKRNPIIFVSDEYAMEIRRLRMKEEEEEKNVDENDSG